MLCFENSKIDQIDDNLWLGDLDAAENVEDLKSKGIKKVLSIMKGYFPKYEEKDNIIHKTLDIDDYPGQNIIQYFGEYLHFINGDEKIFGSLWGWGKQIIIFCDCIYNVEKKNEF